MITNTIFRINLALIILLLAVTSCSENKLSEDKDALLSETETVAEEADDEIIEDEDEGPVFITPSPVVIASLFHRSGVSFKTEATAKPEWITKLKSKPEKSLSLGIYSIDLAYCVLNDKGDVAIDYLTAVKALSDGVGLSQAFETESLFDRFEQNINEKDSIINLLYLIQEKSNDYLADTDQENQMVVLFVGAWVESLHLALYGRKDEWNDKTERRVKEQLAFLQSITEAMKPHARKNVLYQKMNDQLLEVLKLVPTPGLEEGDEIIEDDIELTPESIESIALKVDEIRNMILKA